MRHAALTDADREFMEHATRWWPRLHAGGKLACPDCGGSGYSRGTWMLKHRFHCRCICGKVVTTRGLRTHQNHCGGNDHTEYLR